MTAGGSSSSPTPKPPSAVSTVSPDSSLRLAREPRLSMPRAGDVGEGLGDRAEVAVVLKLKDSESSLWAE